MILVDASVAFKWFIPEEGASEAQRLLEEGGGIVAPELIVAEIGNALWKVHRRGAISGEDYVVAFDDLSRSFADLLRLDGLVTRASEMARQLDHPIYDCFYLASAEELGEPLVTADRRLLSVVSDSAFAALCRPLTS